MLVVLTLMSLELVSSCKDEIPEDSLYTYQTEMMSDYLRNHSDFSMFARIVEKAGKMDLLASYGRYTCFAPTNAAVQDYLAHHDPVLSSVEELSVADCDTLTSTMVINERYEMMDLVQCEGFTNLNLLGRALALKQVAISESPGWTIIVNGSGTIIRERSDYEVANGYIHPVDKVILSSSALLPDVIKKDKNITIFSTCLELTGLDDQLLRIEDESYDYRDWTYKEGLYPSDNHKNWCKVPRTRKFGYTAFCVTDQVLNDEYNITDWQGLYTYAEGIYGNDGGKYDNSPASLKLPGNPLYKLIAYHLLNRKAAYSKLYTDCTVYHGAGGANPTEYYSTMNPLSTLKVEKVYATNKFKGDSEAGALYLNRMYDPVRPNLTQRGAIISQFVSAEMAEEQECRNGYYYYIDRIIDYGTTTQNTVFNNRIRMDLYTFWPELMNNDIRSTITSSGESTELESSTPENFIFPQGYFENVESEADGDFIYQGCRNYYWSYEGDEFNLRSNNNSYDVTFQLPSVPTGTYQIRLGFCLIPSRGIAQFYVDGQPQGIPLDMRSTGWTSRVGWKALTSMNAVTAEQNKKDLHNQGWYHGPRSVRNFSIGAGHLDSELSTSNSSAFCDNSGTVRRVIYQGFLDGDKVHTIRIRSVWADGGAELMLDYIELVPKSVYGIDGDEAGEDDL